MLEKDPMLQFSFIKVKLIINYMHVKRLMKYFYILISIYKVFININFIQTNEYCLQEAALLSKMNHPNIIKFHCYFEGEDNKFSYLM
jgi:serine/threonine protein kinase